MFHTLNFDDLEPIEIPFKLKNKSYVLKEASGDAGCKYRNALLNSTRIGSDGKPTGFTNYADVEPLLVSLCVFERTDPSNPDKDKPVDIKTVRSWPARVVKPLYEKIKEISELDERDETIEELEKQIKEIEHRVAVLKGEKPESANGELSDSSTIGDGDRLKNASSYTTDGSS